MATIKKSDIYDGNTSKAEHITRIIDALDGTATTDISISGSAVVDNLSTGNGQTIVSGSGELNIVAGVNSSVNLASAGKTSGAGFVLPLFQPPAPVQGSAYTDGRNLYIYDGTTWFSVALA